MIFSTDTTRSLFPRKRWIMTPARRFKFGLIALASVFAAVFAWSAAQGQFRPPGFRPPGFRPPGMMGPGIVKVWTCSGCGQELGRGLSAPPNTCPHCGARIINGVGNGIRQPGMPPGGMTPPANMPPANMPPGGMMPPNVNQPPMNVPQFNPGDQPVNQPIFNPPPSNPPPIIGDSSPTTSSNSGDSTTSTAPRKGVLIALVIGVIVVGISVLVGGTFLVIYTMRNSNASKPQRRRRRVDDYDD
jgi:hypothetical protein